MTQEIALALAINSFVVGCKQDGIWDAIKACCIMAAWDGLNGALYPLKGAAPTNYNFVAGDYDRETGLVGNGTTKYLNSNRASNADPRNNQHIACWVSTASTTTSGTNQFAAYIAAGSSTSETSIGRLDQNSANYFIRSRTSGFAFDQVSGASNTGLVGLSRAAGASYVFRSGGTDTTFTRASTDSASVTQEFGVFRDPTNAISYNNGRLAFYSIGESIDLALLDTRTTRFMAEMQFAINTGLNPNSYNIDTINYVNAGYAAGGTLA